MNGRREHKKITLRVEPELYERLALMLRSCSEKQHRTIPINYVAKELLRWCVDEFERTPDNTRQPTFRGFVREHLRSGAEATVGELAPTSGAMAAKGRHSKSSVGQ